MTNRELSEQLKTRYPGVQLEQFDPSQNNGFQTEQNESDVKNQILGLLPAYENFLQSAGVEEGDIKKTIDNIQSDYTTDKNGEPIQKTTSHLNATLESLNAIMPFQKEVALNPGEEQVISHEPQEF